jgi:tetratricopeptide (TPR) repeat protein
MILRGTATLFLLVLLVSSSGCAYLTSFSSDLPARVDSLIKQKEYGKARDILAYVKPGHPDYAQLQRQKKRLATLIKAYEKNVLKTSQRLIKQGEWYAAQRSLEKALARLPDSLVLQHAYAEFIKQRDAYLEKLELSLLLNRANWLIKNAPVQKEMVRVLPTEFRRYPELRDYASLVESTAVKLVECFQNALKIKDYETADQCLMLAENIGSDKIDPKALARAHRELARAEKSRLQKINSKTRALIAELKQGYSYDILRRTRAHLDVLRRKQTRDSGFIKLRKDLEHRFRKGIDRKIAAGRQLYSTGKIKEALSIWTALLEIDPGNEKLQAHINRAKRVLRKLKRLSVEGAAVQPPLKSGARDEGRGTRK